MNCNLVLNYTNLVLIVITVILAVLVYKFVVKGNTEHFQSSDEGQNFVVKDNINKNNIMTLNNVSKYIVVNNPAQPSKKMKMLRMYKESEIIIKRENYHKSDLTIGFYLKKFTGAFDTNFENMLVCKNNDGGDVFKLSYDISNKMVLLINNNTIEGPINNLSNNNYVVIRIKNKKQPEVSLNINNVITKLNLFSENELSMEQFIFTNFHGYLGKIMVYNKYLEKPDICKKYNCNISCFIPDGSTDYGGDVNKCIKACNDKCDDITKCQKICVNCEIDEETWDLETKLKKCPWLSEIKKLDKSIPEAPQIRTYPGDGKILIEWKKPYDNRMPITNYVILVYESFNKDNGLNVTISSDPKCKICEHEVTNLKNQVYYDVSVRAVNGVGIGPSSNIETVSPNGQNKHDIVKNIFMELDDDLDNLITDESIDFACDNKGYKNTENMLLDKIDDSEIDIETLVKKMNV